MDNIQIGNQVDMYDASYNALYATAPKFGLLVHIYRDNGTITAIDVLFNGAIIRMHHSISGLEENKPYFVAADGASCEVLCD